MASPESPSVENPESNREGLAGAIQAPFPLRDPTEKSKEYPPVFMQCLSSSWSDVCELMNWKKEGAAIDVSIFKLAKDPTQVVRSIQAAIVARGGKLEKYGQDGKFGPETEAGLKETLTPLPAAPAEAPREPVSKASERGPERLPPTMSNFEALIDVFKASDERIKTAGLDIKGIDKATITPDLISAYKVKASAFRESLGRENPLLAKLCPIADEMIQVIEEEIKKIDISEVKNRQDFMDTIQDLAKSIESKMDAKSAHFDQVITEAEKAQLERMGKDTMEFKNLEQLELPMAFLISAMNELALTAMEHFGKDPDAVENLMELLQVEWMIPRKPMPRRVLAEDTLLAQEDRWMQLVEHGPYEEKDGSILFPHELPSKGVKTVSFDWDGSIQVNDHRGLLKLPMGASLTRIEALPNGDIQVTGVVSGFEQSIEITKAELDTFLTDLGTGTPGPLYLAGLRVDVSEAFDTVIPIEES